MGRKASKRTTRRMYIMERTECNCCCCICLCRKNKKKVTISPRPSIVHSYNQNIQPRPSIVHTNNNPLNSLNSLNSYRSLNSSNNNLYKHEVLNDPMSWVPKHLLRKKDIN
jgi:hypothetical protein